jgi:hypothetical protein
MTMNTKEASAYVGLMPEGVIDAVIAELRSTVKGNLLDAVSRAEPMLKEFAVLAILNQLQKIAADMLNAECPAPTQDGVTQSWKN